MTDMNQYAKDYDEEMKALEPIADKPLAPAHAIAALALNMAIKYHDMGIVKDGALYQQYKLEGRNLREINLDAVFETAIKMEQFLMGSSERIAALIIDVVKDAVIIPEDEEGEKK